MIGLQGAVAGFVIEGHAFLRSMHLNGLKILDQDSIFRGGAFVRLAKMPRWQHSDNLFLPHPLHSRLVLAPAFDIFIAHW